MIKLKPWGSVYDIDFDSFYEYVDNKYIGTEYEGEVINSIEYRLVHNERLQIGFLNEDEEVFKLFESKTEEQRLEFTIFVGEIYGLKASHIYTDSENETIFIIVKGK